MTDRRLMMHEALQDALPWLRGELQSLVCCEALLVKAAGDEYEPAPNSIDPDARADILPLLDLVRRIEALVGRSKHGPAWLDEIIDGTRSL